MPSFDIVCDVDLQEVDNAVNQATKEIKQRFDFRGSCAAITLNKSEKQIKIVADDDMKLRSVKQILEGKMAKRDLDCRILNYGAEQTAGGHLLKQDVQLRSGLEREDARHITTLIKNAKLKVQAQIQDQQIRVSGKKIDDLQAVITLLKASSLSLPLQYTNMRS